MARIFGIRQQTHPRPMGYGLDAIPSRSDEPASVLQVVHPAHAGRRGLEYLSMLNVDGHAQPVGRSAIRVDVLLYMQARQRGDVAAHLTPLGSRGISFGVVLGHSEDGRADLLLPTRCTVDKKIGSHRDLYATKAQLRLLGRRLDELKRGKLVCHGLDAMKNID